VALQSTVSAPRQRVLVKTGWWCPACSEGLKAVLAEQGVELHVEPLH
jgi:hypothetical protein